MSGRHSRFPAVNRDVPAPVVATETNAGDGYPEAGTTAEVLEWVGDDPARAAVALVAEQQREKPRKGVLDALAG